MCAREVCRRVVRVARWRWCRVLGGVGAGGRALAER